MPENAEPWDFREVGIGANWCRWYGLTLGNDEKSTWRNLIIRQFGAWLGHGLKNYMIHINNQFPWVQVRMVGFSGGSFRWSASSMASLPLFGCRDAGTLRRGCHWAPHWVWRLRNGHCCLLRSPRRQFLSAKAHEFNRCLVIGAEQWRMVFNGLLHACGQSTVQPLWSDRTCLLSLEVISRCCSMTAMADRYTCSAQCNYMAVALQWFFK